MESLTDKVFRYSGKLWTVKAESEGNCCTVQAEDGYVEEMTRSEIETYIRIGTSEGMREIILNYLLENTHIEGLYIGGGEEPQAIVFTHGTDCDRVQFLGSVADDLVKKING